MEKKKEKDEEEQKKEKEKNNEKKDKRKTITNIYNNMFKFLFFTNCKIVSNYNLEWL